MLKIKDEVNLEDLRKLGFNCGARETCFWLNVKRIIINNKTRLISFNAPNTIVYDKLFDLINMGVVECVEVKRDKKREVPNLVLSYINYLDEKGLLEDYDEWEARNA